MDDTQNLRLDDAELRARRAFFEITDEDLQRLAALRPIAERHAHDLIEELYQLILGDFDEVPLAIQQYQSARHGRVGRLHFDRAEGYEAYVEKVLGFAQTRRDATPSFAITSTLDCEITSPSGPSGW